MAEATITYDLSDKGRYAEIAGGRDGKQPRTITVPVPAPLVTRFKLECNGSLTLHLPRSNRWLNGGGNRDIDKPITTAEEALAYLDKWAAAEAAEEAERERRDRENQVKRAENILESRPFEPADIFEHMPAELKARIVAHNTHVADLKAAKAKEIQEAEAKARAEREAAKAAKAAWIAAHGSEYLKSATALGYDCQRPYVTERAAKEFPKFVVDFDDEAKWNARSAPSKRAIELIKPLIDKGIKAEVVWLNDDLVVAGDEYDPQEAVVVRSYLGKYDLIRTNY